MKLNNATQIKSEDYNSEYQELVDQLAETLNPFMQEVVELSDDRIDFENRVEVLKKITLTVDVSGKPVLNDKVNTGKTDIRGIQVIAAFNLTNNTIYPTGQPFISYRILSGGIIQMLNIVGLPADNKFQLTLVIY